MPVHASYTKKLFRLELGSTFSGKIQDVMLWHCYRTPIIAEPNCRLIVTFLIGQEIHSVR
uniref:Uncharacterized protein n=1 Tax=Anguilla anguilla TaxID=7936 RepID=A0A0E9VWI8_ANGAN